MLDPSLAPFVTIIMPVRNEHSSIERTLSSLLAQDYPPTRMEIIVVDGMSTDGTSAIVEHAAQKDARVRLLRNPTQIMASGFNIGLYAARGDLVTMMGGHAELAGDYVSICSKLLQEGIADCVGGAMTTIAEGAGAEAISLAMSSRFGVGGVAFRIGCQERMYVDTVAFGTYTRSIIDRAGPLDEELVRGQDEEFNYRIRKLGGKLLIAPEIHCRYVSRSSLSSLWRQYFQYGYWKIRVLQKHPRQMQIRHFVPALFLSALGASFCVAAYQPGIGMLMFLVLCCLYLAGSALASVQLARKYHKVGLLLRLPVVFAALHCSYGTGFLWGLVKFSARWGEPEKPAAFGSIRTG